VLLLSARVTRLTTRPRAVAKYISDRGKIRGRKSRATASSTSRRHDAIKTARDCAVALHAAHVTERRGGRGNRDDRGRAAALDADRRRAESVSTEAPDVEAEEILAYVDATPVAEIELVKEVAE